MTMVAEMIAGAGEIPLVPPAVTETRHIGADELPWVEVGEGMFAQLLHVDLHQGLWIVKARWTPGTVLCPHYHSGPVYGVTLKGHWYYAETPEAINGPGSYIFEPAGSVHTLVVPEQDEMAEAWFAIYGCNVDLESDGKGIMGINSATVILERYRAALDAAGQDHSRLIVVGEMVAAT